jgi:AraC-type DNA-binding domain-containing proteins
MTDLIINGNFLDFYGINHDFTGTRDVRDSQETVSFHNNSTIRIWPNTQVESFEAHWHAALEIIMPVENYYDVRVGETDYHIRPGEIIVIPPGELHELHAPDSGSRFIFMFDISLITKLKGFVGIQSILSQPLYVTKDTYPQIYEDIYQLLIQMRNEYFNKNEYAELTIFSLLLNFFTKFGYNHINANNLFPNVRLYKQKEYIQKFNSLMEYIDIHYMEELNLEDIAESTGFSKYHFSRLFKQYTGFTFCDYLCHRRIKVAEELLARPDLSITEAALQAGFPSISTFNRLFKQYKNCTPSEYRSRNSRTLLDDSPYA